MIGFLQPLALLALVAAAIPALLHLLGRRLPPTVVFPAVKYLTATEREHSRRLRFRNLLLLILRTAVIVCIVLAASRPFVRTGTGVAHPPTAVALVVDNSLSSAAVLEGHRTLDTIIATARQVIARTATGDRLWLVLADGLPLRKTRLEAIEVLDSLEPSNMRLDLGTAARAAARAILEDPLPNGPVVVVSDLQATAFSPGESPATRVLLWAPPARPKNRWLDSVYSQPEIWTPTGSVVAVVGGSSERPVTLRLRAEGMELARALASPGDRVVLSGALRNPGWTVASVELDSDEMRADDIRKIALLRAEPVAVAMATEVGDFLVEAVSVLQQGGRATSGDRVSLGHFAQAGTSVVFPPSDPAMVGALNRTLNMRGVTWEFRDVRQGEWTLSDQSGIADGIEVYRRYGLSGTGDIFADIDGEPWLVRSGNVVLVASRLEPEWTRLPVSAFFVPFVDYLINRIAAEESWIVTASPGDVVELPATARTMDGTQSAPVTAVPGNHRIVAPLHTGVYFLHSASSDTVGALEVFSDVRESQLQVADENQVRTVFGDDARVLESDQLLSSLFSGEGRINVASLFLMLALAAAVGEFLVASSGGRKRTAV